MNDQPDIPSVSSTAAAPKKGLSLVAWVGIGCGGLILIFIIVMVLGGIFGAKKLKEIGVDFDDPEKATAELIILGDERYEKVSVNDEAREMTIRDKKGNEMTMKFKDIAESKYDRAELTVPDVVPTE